MRKQVDFVRKSVQNAGERYVYYWNRSSRSRVIKGGFPVMAEITRILAANIRGQCFFYYRHYSEYSLLGSEFSTNLLFVASKYHVTIQQQWQLKMFKMAERSDGCSGETLLAPCTRKKRLQRKMTKNYYWIGVQENIGMFSKSQSDRNSVI